jgi:hypothetical protein
MFLTDEEKRMRDGAEGDAVAAAMDLLLRYGAALDAGTSISKGPRGQRGTGVVPREITGSRTGGGQATIRSGSSKAAADEDGQMPCLPEATASSLLNRSYWAISRPVARNTRSRATPSTASRIACSAVARSWSAAVTARLRQLTAVT